MAEFDRQRFVTLIVGPARDAVAPFLAQVGEQAQAIREQFDALEADLLLTLETLAGTNEPAVAQRLQRDLEAFLPARKEVLLARVATILGSDVQAVLETLLVIVVKAAVVAARSFVPIP